MTRKPIFVGRKVELKQFGEVLSSPSGRTRTPVGMSPGFRQILAAGIILAVTAGSTLAVEPAQITVATLSPKQEGFLRELTQQPSLRLVPMAEYRKADIIVNPPENLTIEKLREYLQVGGRILYYNKQPPAEISPFEESEQGKGGVAWVNPCMGEFSEIDWSGHLGGSGWKKVKKGTNVLAVLEDGTPYFVYHAVGNGAVAYLGGKSDIWFHDEMLARAIEYFAHCPLDFSIVASFPQSLELSQPADIAISIENRSTKSSKLDLRLETVPLIHDPFVGKRMAWPSPTQYNWPSRYPYHPGISWDFTGKPQEERTFRESISTDMFLAGNYVFALSLVTEDREELLASWATIVDALGHEQWTISTEEQVVQQHQPMRATVEMPPGTKRISYWVLDPFNRKVTDGYVNSDDAGVANISFTCGKWVPGKYRIGVFVTDREGDFLNHQCSLFYIAPDTAFQPPHWLGRWDVYFNKPGWRERMYNYRELGITFASWTDWGSWWPEPGEWERAEEVLDWAAAAGFKVNFWGINDKSAPPKKLLAHFRIEETDDLHCLSQDGKREGGKCLTEPQMTQAFTQYFDELSRSGLLSYPAFGFFTMSDEGGRFLKCWCDRCLGEYAKWMRGKGIYKPFLRFLMGRRALYEPRTRANMQYLCGHMRGWYKTMIDALHEHTPQLLTTTNHGGMAFTFGRYQYPWAVDDIFQMMEADSYPWWTIEDTDCIMDRTCFTTAILRSAGHFERPVNLIVNAQEVHGNKEVKRPPRMLPNDLLEQIYGAYVEGARSVEFYAETFHHRWHVSFDEWKKYPGLTDMPDDRYAEYLQRPVHEMQSVIREVSKTLDILDPILRLPNRRATIAIVKPIIEEVWFPRWMKPFKEATGGSPIDYLGEDLKGIEHYDTVLLPENIAKSGLPEESWRKLRQWVERGGLLIGSQLSGQHALDLFGAEVEGEPFSSGATLVWTGYPRPIRLDIPPQASPRVVRTVTAVKADSYENGAPAAAWNIVKNGKTLLLGFDLAGNVNLFRHVVLPTMLERDHRLPLVQSSQPHVNLSVKEVDGTFYVLALYYREPVTWSPQEDTLYPDPLETEITLNVDGDYDAYDVFSSKPVPLEVEGGRLSLTVSLPLSRLRAYAIVPHGPDKMTISVPKLCKSGMKMPYRVNSAATKLIRIDFIIPYPWRKPDDRLSHYALTNRQYLLDSCDNDLPGKWILRVTDLHTGKGIEDSFEMTRLFPKR